MGISEQVKRVTHRTVKSHVSTFGDTSFEDEPIGTFKLTQAVNMAFPLPGSSAGAVDIRDIPLRLAYNAWEQAETEDQKLKTWEHLKSVVAAREADEQLFQKIADSSCAAIGSGCAYSMIHSKQAMKDLDCRELTATLHEACPRRANHDAGGWNAFNMKFSQTLVNLCESRARLHKELQEIRGIVRKVCNDASKTTSGAVLV